MPGVGDDWRIAPLQEDEYLPPRLRRKRRQPLRDRKAEIEAKPKPPVKKKTPARVLIPNFKRQCIRCHGTGRAPCQICNGTGQVLRGLEANGAPRFGGCTGCLGIKLAKCQSCGGEGFT